MAYNNRNPRIYETDGEAWKRLYADMADNSLSNNNAFYRLKKRHTNPEPVQAKVQLVTPAAQTTEAAKVNLENERSIMDPVHYNGSGQVVGRAPAKKRGKPKMLKDYDGEDDIFA